MTDIHTDYLKEDHFEDDEDEELNIEHQKSNSSYMKIITRKKKLLMNNYKTISCSKWSSSKSKRVSSGSSRYD